MHIIRKRVSTLLGCALLCASALTAAGPRYASDETREIVERMITAHGGMDRWQAAPAISFDGIMHNGNAGSNELAWWIAHEIVEQGSRRAFQRWPLDGATLAWDGEQVWTDGWRRANPPEFQVHSYYFAINLPWLTQDDGVLLSEPGSFTWPGTSLELIAVKMTFERSPGVAKTVDDYFVLLIDPTTDRLRGYQYAIAYPPMLELMGVPEDRRVFGPMWRMITREQTVDGLVFPAAMRTMPEPNGRVVGNHVIMNIDVATPFDERLLVPPAGAGFVTAP